MKKTLYISSKFNSLTRDWAHTVSTSFPVGGHVTTEVEVELVEPSKMETLQVELQEYKTRAQFARENMAFWESEIERIKGELK